MIESNFIVALQKVQSMIRHTNLNIDIAPYDKVSNIVESWQLPYGKEIIIKDLRKQIGCCVANYWNSPNTRPTFTFEHQIQVKGIVADLVGGESMGNWKMPDCS